MPISRRGLTAAGLALVAVGALGVTSILNADAIEVTKAPPAATSAPDADLQTPPSPPPPLPGAPMKPPPNAGRLPALSPQDADAARTRAPLKTTPLFGPKGLPGRTPAKPVNKVSTFDAQTSGARTFGMRTVAAQRQALANLDPAWKFHWVSASQAAETDGTYATLTIGRPELAGGEYHSLAEVAARSADGQQIVEVGWIVSRNLNGDSEPHLFVYRWVDRQPSCYNGCGYRQVSPTVRPGATLPVDAAKRFGIQHFGNAWWINYDNEWIGYYPDSVWAGRNFDRAGLTQWWGEVAAPSDKEPCSDMGNGIVAAEPRVGQPRSAEIRSIGLVNGPEVKIAAGASGPYYGLWQPKTNTGATSPNAFRYGGPGAC